jgi:hypothetical protein
MSGSEDGASTLTVISDNKTKFPLLSIPNVPFGVMWLPLTRIQLEFFLSDVNDVRYDSNWYQNVISKDNPRTSPNRVNNNNLRGVVTTNILLKEIQRIADWFGHHETQIYDLPTGKQWETIVGMCSELPAISLENIPADTDPRARILLQRLQEINQPNNLADQMLLGRYISEYVYRDDTRQTCQIVGRTVGGQIDFTSLRSPHDWEGDRQTRLSFRLIRQEL